MKTKQILTATALAGILTMAAAAAQAEHKHPTGNAEPASTEKCFGVVRAGRNDCGTPTHSCAGHTEGVADGDKNEWVMVPTGLCDKLVNGSLTAPAAELPKTVKPTDFPAEIPAEKATDASKDAPAKKE